MGDFFIGTIIVGIMFTVLGVIIKYQKAGDMINGFSYQKHDKEKVSKIMGNHLLFIGIGIFVLDIISISFNGRHIVLFKYLQIILLVLVLLRATYLVNKYGNKIK